MNKSIKFSAGLILLVVIFLLGYYLAINSVNIFIRIALALAFSIICFLFLFFIRLEFKRGSKYGSWWMLIGTTVLGVILTMVFGYFFILFAPGCNEPASSCASTFGIISLTLYAFIISIIFLLDRLCLISGKIFLKSKNIEDFSYPVQTKNQKGKTKLSESNNFIHKNFKPKFLKVLFSILIPLIVLMPLLDIRLSFEGLIYFIFTGGIYLVVGFVLTYVIWSFFQKHSK